MPKICSFNDINIIMYGREREHPPPHFHVRYGQYRAEIEIGGFHVRGELPTRELKQVLAWAEIHKEQLHENWRRLWNGEVPLQIPADVT